MKISEKIRVERVVIPPELQIPAHSHEIWEVAYVLIGKGKRIIGDRELEFSEGEVVLVPPGMMHCWQFDSTATDGDGNISNITVFFDSSLLKDVAETLPDFKMSVENLLSRNEAITFRGKQLEKLQQLLLRLADDIPPEEKTILFFSLITELGCFSEDEITVGIKIVAEKTALKKERVRIFCDCNYMRKVTLKDGASHVGMNISSFCKFFHKNFGVTFSDHINNLRLEEASKRLISTNDSVSSIAYDLGFTSIPYFNRLFRTHFQCTPTDIRQRH